ncbi:MAG: hypothetical protein OEZ01_09985, partial [Candidatus Heimdallarchaeota archaeon]|nr:hypothetical protein [Candidatus Heimdallarchaeota archaeon]
MNEFHRINKNEKQKSWLLRNFLLTINFYLMFLLFDGKFFLYVIGFFGFFTVILLLKKIIQSTSFRRELNSKDLTKIIYKFLKINKLFIVAAILGLIFSTIILAQIVLVSGSYDQQIFTEMVADSQDNYILTYEGHIDLQFAELNSMIGDLEHSAINLLNSHNFEYLESFVNFRHSIPVVLNSMDDEYTESTSINLYEWNDNFFQFLYQFPSFDKSLVFNESLNLAIFDPDCDLDTDYIYNNGLGVIPNNDMTQNISFSIPVDRIWKTTQQDDIYFNENELWNNPFGIYIGENMYITNRTHLEHILNEYSEVIDSRGGYNDGSSSFRLFIIAEIPDLHTINLDEYKKRLRRLVLDAERDLYQQDVQEGNYLGVYSPLLSNIMNYEFYVVGLKLTMLLVSGPLLIISMYLVYFSLSLVESRKSRLVAIMKIRGISTEQATITMISEVIFGSILALITGLIMSIPWTILSLKSSGLLEFDASPIPLVIPTDFYWKLPFMSMILAFNLNIASIRALSKTSVDSAEVFIEKRPPFWQRYYLDLIGFGTSLVYLIYIRIIPVEVNEIFDIVLQVIGIYMLFIFILFAPLVVSRYFSNAIGIASDYIWNKEGGIIALSTKNMGKNRFSSSKLVTLMMFGLMCSTIGIVIPDTFMSYTEEKQY